jgi:hypothetical protein
MGLDRLETNDWNQTNVRHLVKTVWQLAPSNIKNFKGMNVISYPYKLDILQAVLFPIDKAAYTDL